MQPIYPDESREDQFRAAFEKCIGCKGRGFVYLGGWPVVCATCAGAREALKRAERRAACNGGRPAK
jgi:hypothetical protein